MDNFYILTPPLLEVVKIEETCSMSTPTSSSKAGEKNMKWMEPQDQLLLQSVLEANTEGLTIPSGFSNKE